MNSILAFVLIPAGIWATGCCFLRFFMPVSQVSDSRTNTYAFLLGLTIFSYFWFVAGLFGGLHAAALYCYEGFALLSFFLVRQELLQLFQKIRGCLQAIRQSDRLSAGTYLLLLIVLLATLSRCWAGYIEGDSLVYHLYLPKQFVMQAGIWDVPYSEHAFWPLFAEMCFVPGELIDSLALSKLISYFVFLATVVLVGQSVYRSTQNLTAALLSALLIAGSPVFFFHASSTYSDLFFNVFLVACFFLYLDQREKGFEQAGRWMLLSGLFGGAAMACKYLALYGILALGVIMAADFIFGKNKARVLKCYGLFIVGFLLTGAPYYLRAYLQYANPVFPFAASFFGTPFGYLTQDANGLIAAEADLFAGAGRSFWDFLSLPFKLTFQPDLFLGDKLGFLFLPASVFVLFAWKRNVRSLIYGLIYTLCWFFLMQLSRYMLPVYTLLAFMIGQGYHVFETRYPSWRKGVLALLLVLAAVQTAWGVYHAYKDLFLRVVPEVTQVAQEVNNWVGNPKAKVLILGDYNLYDYDFVAIREKGFRNFTHYPDAGDPVKLAALLDEQGITHFLLISSSRLRDKGFDSEPYFQQLITANLYTLQQERPGREAVYRLYRRAAPSK